MKVKRVFAAILAFSAASVMLASCVRDRDGDEPTYTTQVDSSEAEIAEIDRYVDGLASEFDFDGATFTYIGRDDSNFPSREEETGAILSDAVYFRQRDIEEKFGVDWVNKATRYGDDTQDLVIRSVLSNTPTYDLVYGSMLTVGQPLLLNDAIMSVEGFNHLDLSRDWWAESLEETFMIKDKLYFLTGPIVTNHYSDTSCILFNKKLAEEYELPDLYSLVTDGDWTVDKMFECAEYIPVNGDGTGIFRYGNPSGIEWIFSSGMQIMLFTEDGTPFVETEPSEKLIAVADKMSTVFGDDSICCSLKKKDNSYRESSLEKYGVGELDELFTSGRVLFWFAETGDISSLRKEKAEFGVLPMPMWDKEQKQYRSYASQWGGAAVYVPKNVRNTEMVDVVIEAAAALSQKYVKSAFYDRTLKTGGTYDSQSKGMLDIVVSTKAYDIVDVFSGGDMNRWGALMNLLDSSICEDDSRLKEKYPSDVMMVTRNISNVLKIISKED